MAWYVYIKSELVLLQMSANNFFCWSGAYDKCDECFVDTFSNLPQDSLPIFEKGQIYIEGNYFKLLGRIIFKLEEFWWNNYFEFLTLLFTRANLL